MAEKAYIADGSVLGKVYHAGKIRIKKVDPSRLGERDAGWYGAGFYVAKDPEFVHKYYGPVVTEFEVSPKAKVLLGSISADKAPEGLFDAVLEHDMSLPSGTGDVAERHFIASQLKENQTEWVHAVDRLAEEEDFDIVIFSDYEIVVKSPKVLSATKTKFHFEKLRKKAKLVVLPANHEPAMEVPKGGSSCATCTMYEKDDDSEHGICHSSEYKEYYGTNKIPHPADQYCSDWYNPKKEAFEKLKKKADDAGFTPVHQVHPSVDNITEQLKDIFLQIHGLAETSASKPARKLQDFLKLNLKQLAESLITHSRTENNNYLYNVEWRHPLGRVLKKTVAKFPYPQHRAELQKHAISLINKEFPSFHVSPASINIEADWGHVPVSWISCKTPDIGFFAELVHQNHDYNGPLTLASAMLRRFELRELNEDYRALFKITQTMLSNIYDEIKNLNKNQDYGALYDLGVSLRGLIAAETPIQVENHSSMPDMNSRAEEFEKYHEHRNTPHEPVESTNLEDFIFADDGLPKTAILSRKAVFLDQSYSDKDGEYRVADIFNLVQTLNRPVVNFPIDDLLNNLEPSPEDEEDSDTYPGSTALNERAAKADLQYPIIIIKYPDGYWIADGVHRLHKAVELKHKTIKAYVLQHSELKKLKTIDGPLAKFKTGLANKINEIAQQVYDLSFTDHMHALSLINSTLGNKSKPEQVELFLESLAATICTQFTKKVQDQLNLKLPHPDVAAAAHKLYWNSLKKLKSLYQEYLSPESYSWSDLLRKR